MTILHSITTVAGHNKEAARKALNQPVVFTHIALGDDDRYPTGGETELGNEVHRGAITGKGTVPGVPNATFFDITVPDDVATFFAREIGLIDEDGVLYALSRYDAPIPKFGPDSANQSAFTFRIIVIFSATANIVIEVDPGWKHTIDAQLRPDFRSVEAIQNDPPVAPVAGQTWIAGVAPIDAWGGHENELAEWSANGWTFIPPTPWMHVGLADRTDWRWDHMLDPPAWVEWKAGAAVRGPVNDDDVKNRISGAKALFNVQQIPMASRTVISGVTGYHAVLSGTFSKISDTSNLVFFLSSPSFVGGAAGPGLARLTLGGINSEGVAANNDASLAKGQTSFNGLVSGLPAGDQPWAYYLGRGDATAWSVTVNPSTADASYFPAGGTRTTLLIGEIEP